MYSIKNKNTEGVSSRAGDQQIGEAGNKGLQKNDKSVKSKSPASTSANTSKKTSIAKIQTDKIDNAQKNQERSDR